MTNTDPEPFVPYRDRPPLDKGATITWQELESGMLFEPGVSEPHRRRVRGTPIHVEANRSYIIGSEEVETGEPRGGIEGTDTDVYRRTYDEHGRAVYIIDLALSGIAATRQREAVPPIIVDCDYRGPLT